MVSFSWSDTSRKELKFPTQNNASTRNLCDSHDVEDYSQTGCYHHLVSLDFIALIPNSSHCQVNQHTRHDPDDEDAYQGSDNL